MFQPHRFEGQAARAAALPLKDNLLSMAVRRGVMLAVDPRSDQALLADAADAAGFELVVIDGARAAEWLERRLGAVDIIWCNARERCDAALLDLLARDADSRGCRFAVAASLDTLDAVDAVVGALPHAEILVDPGPAACLLLLARAGGVTRAALNDPARTEADARIDHLQEEVERIVQMLGMLRAPAGAIAHGHGAIGLHGGFDDGMIGYSAPSMHNPAVRSPSRGFNGMPHGGSYGGAPVDAAFVRRLIRQRRLRDRFFPADIFADPAWDMLLDLFAARLEGRSVSVSSLCIASAVPATTALRWIKSLTEAGIFARQSDPQDGRRIFVALSDSAEAAMRDYCAAMASA